VQAAQAAVAARESAHLPGQMLGSRYLIERVLAERKIGIVLGAVDQQSGEEVAVRIIDPAFSDEALDRLFIHRDHLLRADHPNLLRIHDLAREEHTTYVVEDYHPGPTLERFLEAYPRGVPIAHALTIAREITAGLAYAHAQEIVHSNLGAEKIFVDDSGVKIGGMALGHLEGRFNLMEVPLLRQDAAYLAPEQVLAQPIDARSDLYALGVIFYQIFTGRLPFTGSEGEVLQAHLLKTAAPPAALNEQIPPAINNLICKLLAKSAADRCETAQEVVAELGAAN
jgi:serine/threonine protein kinase